MKEKLIGLITIRNISTFLCVLIIIFEFALPLFNISYSDSINTRFRLHTMSFSLTIFKDVENYKFDGNIAYLLFAIIPLFMGLFSVLVRNKDDASPEIVNIAGSVLMMILYILSLSWIKKNESLSIDFLPNFIVRYDFGTIIVLILFTIILLINLFNLGQKDR